MLNRIIRLQAVVEITTNQIATALECLAGQQTQMCATIYQTFLTSDYPLAEEGDWEKRNPSDCCLQIDDNEKP
jgi:predicted metalloprotease with PDZ domain